MKTQSHLIIYSFKDLQDWQAMKQCTFEKKECQFDLKQKLEEVVGWMKLKAEGFNLHIICEPNFESQTSDQGHTLAHKVQYEQMKKDLEKIDQNLENHPLLKFIPLMQHGYMLPTQVRGDWERLQ